MTDTKRVDELEVGDIVNPPYSKRVLTVESIEKVGGKVNKIYYERIRDPWHYGTTEEFTYLGNRKEEEIMKTQKIDCSVLYSYFDLLAGDEINLKGATNIPVYVRQQLKNIHELFEGILGLTLEEVKTLYFERKMSKEKSKVEKSTETKKAGELKIGDVIIFPDSEESKTVYSIRKRKDGLVLDISFLEKENVYNVGRDVRVIYLFNDRDAVYRRARQRRNGKDSEFITKKVKELCIGDKVSLPQVQKEIVVTKIISKLGTNLIMFEGAEGGGCNLG